MCHQTLLRVCRVFLRVQQIDWDAFRNLLQPIKRLFEESKKSVLDLRNEWKFQLEVCLTRWRSVNLSKKVQSALKLFGGVSSTQKEPETYLQHYHTTKIEASKVLSKFEKIHRIFGTQLLLDNAPPQMALESLLWVSRHF